MRSRSLSLSLALIAATVAAGLVVRFAPLSLPWFVAKYGGSMLWALMVYWIVSMLLPGLRIAAVAAIACGVAACVECFKLYHSPALDAFRLTTPGILLLGRFFSVWNIAAYWLAICLGAAIDMRMRSTAR